MPVALDPNQRIDIWLDSDKDKPAETRPTFVTRFLTVRETLVYEQALKDAGAEKNNQAARDKLIGGLSMVLVSWRNMTDRDGNPIAFNLAEVDALLTVSELWWLAYQSLHRAQLSEDERGKSALPPA
jgi:hypothetical protein